MRLEQMRLEEERRRQERLQAEKNAEYNRQRLDIEAKNLAAVQVRVARWLLFMTKNPNLGIYLRTL
jgi:hypothetical protein